LSHVAYGERGYSEKGLELRELGLGLEFSFRVARILCECWADVA